MKIVLAQNAPYFPTYGGANKANRAMLDALVAHGHQCWAVSVAIGLICAKTLNAYVVELKSNGISSAILNENTVRFQHCGVNVTAVETRHLRTELLAQIRAIQPDWILVSSEDPLYMLLQSALETRLGRIAYLAHTTALLPFGPAAFFPNSRGTALLKQAHAVIAISNYVQDYLKMWGTIEAVKVNAPLYIGSDFSSFSYCYSGDVLMINPCALKGISIFLELARSFPAVSFAAVPTWGTNYDELQALRTSPNIKLFHPVENIDELLSSTRVLLVPSLWYEGFGLIVIETMLHGIPVIASNVGGLGEAKLGIEYLLPVNPIIQYRTTLDRRLLPEAVVPE